MRAQRLTKRRFFVTRAFVSSCHSLKSFLWEKSENFARINRICCQTCREFASIHHSRVSFIVRIPNKIVTKHDQEQVSDFVPMGLKMITRGSAGGSTHSPSS